MGYELTTEAGMSKLEKVWQTFQNPLCFIGKKVISICCPSHISSWLSTYMYFQFVVIILASKLMQGIGGSSK